MSATPETDAIIKARAVGKYGQLIRLCKQFETEVKAWRAYFPTDAEPGMVYEVAKRKVPELQQKLAEETAAFKNFHANLCKRFGYGHDETDWRRDLASLEEWIAKDKARMDLISAKFILASRAKHPEDGLTWLAIDGKTVRKETLRACIDELLAIEKQIS